MNILKLFAFGVLIYLIWALIHHKRDKSLTFNILLEYLLTVLLSMVILTGVSF
ncbi:hypothetical protein HYW41_01640 [Candidatus Daviesbacteria bacterium]|nr:hypothetical protein [Candidatus Daviesbacteria bacterium]